MPVKKTKKNKNKKPSGEVKRTLEFKGNLEEYAKVTAMLGDRRIMVTLIDGSESIAVIPGRFRKRCWMSVGDIVLISYREFQDSKLDVIHKYNSDEVRKLVQMDELPENFMSKDVNADEDDEVSFREFTEEEEATNKELAIENI